MKAETALMYDAVHLFAKALHDLDTSQQIDIKPLSCDAVDFWPHGYSLINYMKVVEMRGLTGVIKFDHQGFRSDFMLDIVELTREGLKKIGTWNASEGVNFTRTYGEAYTQIVEIIQNKTFVVTTILSSPYVMRKEASEKLTGNAQFEGYAVDLIHEISRTLGFNYTIKLAPDGRYGSLNRETSEWDGMIRPLEAKESLKRLRNKDADLDLEIDSISNGIERQKTEQGRPQDLLLVPSNRKAILIMTVLNAGQHLSCISVMYMNLHPILNAAGSIYLDNNITAIVFAIIMLLASIFASCTIDKFGRKIILVVSSLLSGFCLLALSVYFHLQAIGFDVSAVSWVPIASVLVYAGAFKYGLGLVPIVITAEIFPAKMKAIGMTVADVMFVMGGILSIQLYQVLHKLGMFVPFYLFTVSAFLVALYSGFCIPETKGKSLEQIQLMLKGDNISNKPEKNGV
ncbi:hypothetical protein HUJ05_008373 [Dendroctonus ponderosae]|nr:hypothetical protein HUJ05_008373 [Dendroctonus ponderosae]